MVGEEKLEKDTEREERRGDEQRGSLRETYTETDK